MTAGYRRPAGFIGSRARRRGLRAALRPSGASAVAVAARRWRPGDRPRPGPPGAGGVVLHALHLLVLERGRWWAPEDFPRSGPELLARAGPLPARHPEDGEAIRCGMIYVAPGAQKTDGYQANRNLVLSDAARADSIPGLEILADDVRCTHGATVGKLEQEPLFYLKSRGIPQAEAEKMVVEGFFAELVDTRQAPVADLGCGPGRSQARRSGSRRHEAVRRPRGPCGRDAPGQVEAGLDRRGDLLRGRRGLGQGRRGVDRDAQRRKRRSLAAARLGAQRLARRLGGRPDQVVRSSRRDRGRRLAALPPQSAGAGGARAGHAGRGRTGP